MWRQRRGRGFPEPSKAEQRPGPLPVLLLLSRLDILVKPSNNAEFSLGSCFYHLFKGWGKTKLYKLENPSEEGASKRNAVTHEPEVFLLVLKRLYFLSQWAGGNCLNRFTFTWKWSLMLKPCGYQSRTGLPSCVFLLRSGSLPEKWWCYRSDSFMMDQNLIFSVFIISSIQTRSTTLTDTQLQKLTEPPSCFTDGFKNVQFWFII